VTECDGGLEYVCDDQYQIQDICQGGVYVFYKEFVDAVLGCEEDGFDCEDPPPCP
jgi:hypothetical protein